MGLIDKVKRHFQKEPNEVAEICAAPAIKEQLPVEDTQPLFLSILPLISLHARRNPQLSHKRQKGMHFDVHTLFVSNPCMATAIILVSQNLFYEQLPEKEIFFGHHRHEWRSKKIATHFF